VNYILSRTENAVSKLINIPDSMLEHVKFSKIFSGQLYKVYLTSVEEWGRGWRFLTLVTFDPTSAQPKSVLRFRLLHLDARVIHGL